MSIEIRAMQLNHQDFMTLPIRDKHGCIQIQEYDTSYIQDKDVVIVDYDKAQPYVKDKLAELVQHGTWDGHTAKSVTLTQSNFK